MDYYGMNELPYSYKRYKGLTGYFEKWLMNVAKERGLEIANQVEAEAAKRKKTGGSKSHHILIKDLLPMAEAVAKSGQPSKDTSGLADLDDAIRIRKEVTQWYRLQHQSDEEHPYFTSVLADVRKVFKDWIFVKPTQSEACKSNKESLGNKNQNSLEQVAVIVGYFDDLADTDDNIDGPDTDSNVETEPDRSKAGTGPDKRLPSLNAPDAEFQVPKADLRIDREFEVLCFLYDLYSLRQRVKSVWSDWSQRKIGTMTAAVVSDLAMAHIQQRVASLAKELTDDGNNQDILGIVDKLMQLIPEDQRDVALSDKENGSQEYPRDLFCYDGIRTMSEYWRLEAAGAAATHGLPRHDSFRLRFLLHFKVIGTGGLEAPAMDKFTESLCSTDSRSKVWLPFGFQVLLDIQQLLLIEDKTMGELRDDVLDHGLYIEEIMRQQIDYEDKMCAIGEKPGYMSTDDFKFSNTYLPTLMRLLDWRLQLQHDDCEEVSEMCNLAFVAAHPIFCGITMWFYHRLYHSGAISTICWFMVGLAHIYNACRQVGGLKSPWPDLEFVIQSQGPSRIFIGGPPTEPDTFYQRVRLALGNSVREHASDYYRHKNDRLNSVGRQKRGLANYPLLEAKIVAYYQTKTQENRSSLLHNIFVFLHKDLGNTVAKGSTTSPNEEESKTSQIQEKVRIIFKAIALKRALRTKNKKTRKKNKSKVPDFYGKDGVHDKSLDHATSQLAKHELYANFDHFAFFRRAYEIVKRIRTEILWDSNKALITLDAAQEAPNDLSLLVSLLINLAPPQDKNDSVYAAKHALGMEKLESIAKIMQEFISERGDLELKNAEGQMKRRREHGTVPREKLSLESVKEANIQGTNPQMNPLLKIEAKPVKDAAPKVSVQYDHSGPEPLDGFQPVQFRSQADQFMSELADAPEALLFGKQPVQCGGQSTEPFHLGNEPVQFSNQSNVPFLFGPEPIQSGKQGHGSFHFGNYKHSTFDFDRAVDIAAKAWGVPSPFNAPENKKYSEPEDAAVKPEAKSWTAGASIKPEANSALEISVLQPEAVHTSNNSLLKLSPASEPQRDEVDESARGENLNTCQSQGNATVTGELSAFHNSKSSPDAIQARVDQENQGRSNRWSDVGEEIESAKSADDRALESDLSKYIAFRQAIRAQYPSMASPVSDFQPDEEARSPSPLHLPPRAEDITDHAPGERKLTYSLFDVYHRFTYRSTRSTRPQKYISSARLDRLLTRTRKASGSTHRLVGAVKHRICHNCYGRCMVGHALLGAMHDAWWYGAITEDDGWETDDGSETDDEWDIGDE
ncbi:hypothetical protein PMIN04_001736 [Paraphaeosphaeria minitans]